MTKLPSKRKLYTLAFGIGGFLFIFCHVFDLFFYPHLKIELLLIRIFICLLLILGGIILRKIHTRWYDLLAAILAICSGLSVTAMAALSGDGFASPLYAGHFLIIMVYSLLFYLGNRLYIGAVIVVMLQHFTILSFFPAEGKFVLLQVLALVPSVLIGMLNHHIIYSFFIKTRMLENFLPICANCKKIRDDEGYWNQIESYIKANFGTEFTHGICPDCMLELYGYTTEDLKRLKN